MNMFKSANGFEENTETLLCSSAHIYDKNDNLVPNNVKEVYEEFVSRYNYNKPINTNLRMKFISFLEMKKTTSYNIGNSKLMMIFYNSTWVVIICCIIWIITLLKKNWKLFIILFALALKFAIVIATCPMPAYMYYFSTHLICSFIVVYFILEILYNKKLRGGYKC